MSGFDRPRSEPCVQEPQLDTSNETHQGPPERYAGISDGLLSKHRRYQAFMFFEVEFGIISQVESKTGKSRMDRTENLIA